MKKIDTKTAYRPKTVDARYDLVEPDQISDMDNVVILGLEYKELLKRSTISADEMNTILDKMERITDKLNGTETKKYTVADWLDDLEKIEIDPANYFSRTCGYNS